jgi:hypothetical protein
MEPTCRTGIVKIEPHSPEFDRISCGTYGTSAFKDNLYHFILIFAIFNMLYSRKAINVPYN